MTDPNDTTPIGEVVEVLGLPDDVLDLPGVRTLGDLLVALDRGDVPERTVRALELIAYLNSPLYVEHLKRAVQGLQKMARPGVMFTDEQQAQIRAIVELEETSKE